MPVPMLLLPLILSLPFPVSKMLPSAILIPSKLLAMPVISSLPSAVLNLPELSMPKLPLGSNYVVTLGRIERAGVVMPSPPPNPPVAVIMSLPSAVLNVPVLKCRCKCRPPLGSNYVVTLGRIQRAGVVNAAHLPSASNYVVTLGRIQRAGVVNAVSTRRAGVEKVVAPSASNYVVTLGRIQRAGVENAVSTAGGERVGWSPMPVIVSLPARVLAIPVLTMSSSPDSGTISAWLVNVIVERSIVIGRPRNYN
jgi:hypothetical protein